jgi:LemA protein
MKTSNLVLISIGALILFLGGCACTKYNGLVTADTDVQKVWSNVETNYQRRTDLYSSLKDVLAARASATQVKVDINDPATLAKYQAAQGQLQSAFGRLMAVAESYPDLKTTKSFQDFQAQIEGTENRINVARQDYNRSVEGYNLKVRTFPNNIFASFFGFKTKEFYKADAGSEKAPDVQFNIK